MDYTQFYISHNTEKYPPDGHFNECKKCLTRHVNNFDPETYLWILQEADVPYIESEWNKLLEKYGKEPEKLTGTTILGRYLSKMKLLQYKHLRWDDTQRLKEEANQRISETMAEQGYNDDQIAEAVSRNGPALVDAPAPPQVPDSPTIDLTTPEYFNDDLTEEDKKYLSIKLGRVYKPHEWVQLEQYYSDMTQSFDI